MTEKNTSPNEDHVLPNGAMLIEGAADADLLLTDQPVAPSPRRGRQSEPQAEKLLEVEPISLANGREEDPRLDNRPARGRLAMASDVNAGARKVQTELEATELPVVTEKDRLLGAEQARKMAERYGLGDHGPKAA